MLDAMSSARCAVGLGSVFVRIERHVNGLVADGVQHDLEAFAIVERDGLIEVVRLPEGNPAAAADIGIEHGGCLCIDGAVEKSFDRTELQVGTAEGVAEFPVVREVVGGERPFEFVRLRRSSLFRQDDGREAETKLQFAFRCGSQVSRPGLGRPRSVLH